MCGVYNKNVSRVFFRGSDNNKKGRFDVDYVTLYFVRQTSAEAKYSEYRTQA